MLYEVKQSTGFKCTIHVPGSKSITNRAMLIGALADGRTILHNALFSDDTKYMADALKSMGISVVTDEGRGRIEINGAGDRLHQVSCHLGNAGTVMRFLPSFVSVKGGEVILTGIERMKERPIGQLVDMLNALGAEVSYLEKEGYPPIKVKSNGLNGGKIRVKGSISSQFISSILLNAPYAGGDISIEIEDDLVSKPYVDITIGVMQDFGVKVENREYKYFNIKSGQRYQEKEYTVESDCSSASYFFGAAAIAQGDITVRNVSPNSLQGDIRFVDILERMGARVERGEDYVRVVGKKLKGISVDMNDISDVAQTLAVTALFAEGPTEIRNVYNMRLKETDRLAALKKELEKIGAGIIEKKDGIVINPAEQYKSADIDTYNDHRMAMSFALAGLRIPGLRIKNPGCVSKTFPNFFEEFEKMYR